MATPALGAAISGAQASQTRIDVIAADIANVNSVAYKGNDVVQTDLFYATLKRAGTIENAEASRRPIGIQVGYGTKVTGTSRNLTQGSIRETGGHLDVAILKTGYLAVNLPNNRVGYTRVGALKRDPETGLVITSEGDSLTNALTIPLNVNLEDVNIAANGAITGLVEGNPNNVVEIGNLQLFTFPNQQGLVGRGKGIYEESLASGEAIEIEDTSNSFQQRALEESNVSAVGKLTELITAQRAFELNSRVIRVVDEIQKDVNAIK